MSLVTYAAARATVAAQITSDLAADGWSVYDFPPDSFDPPAVILAFQEADRVNPSTWRRDLIVGLFVRRDDPSVAADLLDATLPDLVASLETVGHMEIGTVSRPEPVTWNEITYLAQFVPVTLETTP